LDAALSSFDQAIALNDDDGVAWYSRAKICGELGRVDQALAAYDKAIALNPGFVQAHFNRGVMLQQSQELDAALESYDRVIAIKPDHAEAHANKAFALYLLKRFDAALASYDKAIAMRPDHATAYLHRGNALKETNQLEAALASYDQAIAIKPDYAEVYSNRGSVLFDLHRIDASLASFDRAIAIKPGYAEAYFNRASVLRVIRRFEAAAADFEAAAALDPDIRFLPGARLEARMQTCDWGEFDAGVAEVATSIEGGKPASHPFAFLTFSGSPKLQRRAAEIWVRETCPADDSLGAIHPRPAHSKIRVGYFSADFRNHPVSFLTAGLIETHDRSAFEVIAFSFGPDGEDDMRRRLRRAFDRFIDVRERSDRQIAELARSLELDIAIDLGGFTEGCRSRIFALRAAPLQLSYLGYLGTMGAPYMDYLVADSIIVPPEYRQHYAEKLLYLPSYQANDSQRHIADRCFTRDELGLPDSGFVFCCFNANYKIQPATFAGWMRILTQVPGSVLMLSTDSATAVTNLRREALRLGVDPARLVFGARLPLPEYLARYRSADLFLDTLPYNAGTTASDALWAGLPVLTCTGESFASRVAASLLTTLELPDLITSTQAEYERRAIALATDAGRLAQVKQRLAVRRTTAVLFDTRRFARHLENGFRRIYERYQAGLPPEHTDSG
jgi:predicted O-linked N-acetylglucosamine transferase (SPINDLY family)